jgi:hypothetical protein
LESFFEKGHSLKAFRWLWVFLVLILMITFMSYKAFSNNPLTVFLLLGTGDSIEAFNVQLFFSGIKGQVKNVDLTPSQKKEASTILNEKDLSGLIQLSHEVDGGKIVVGIIDMNGNWPWFLRDSCNGWFFPRNENYFDNLCQVDRIYLNLTTEMPPMPLFQETNSQNNKLVQNPVLVLTPTSASSLPLPKNSKDGLVYVEILNGCGITNAADWAARRLKGQGIIISGIANADNFNHRKTIVRSSIGCPVALEDALERMGFFKKNVEESGIFPGGVDVIIILGKDYLSLRGNKNRE